MASTIPDLINSIPFSYLTPTETPQYLDFPVDFTFSKSDKDWKIDRIAKVN